MKNKISTYRVTQLFAPVIVYDYFFGIINKREGISTVRRPKIQASYEQVFTVPTSHDGLCLFKYISIIILDLKHYSFHIRCETLFEEQVHVLDEMIF